LPTFTNLGKFVLPQAPPKVAVMVTCPLKLFCRVATPVEELIERPDGLEEDQDGVVPNGWFNTVKFVPEEHTEIGDKPIE